jgi:hypothetical protein
LAANDEVGHRRRWSASILARIIFNEIQI